MNKLASHRFPNFLGIGAMRSGTSWLYQLLKSHPEVFMPTHVKELHFFDDYYERGLSWYLSFFPSNGESAAYKAAGEITPRYLYNEEIPGRVKLHFPDARFIVILRNPIDRAYSHYKLAFYEGATKAPTFSDFMQEEPSTFGRGLYATQLRRWFDHFPRDRFLILIFEEAMREPMQAAASLADFLGIDREGFNEDRLTEKTNASQAHKLAELHHAGKRLKNYLRENDLHWAAHFVVTSGRRFFKLLGEDKSYVPPLESEIKEQLSKGYAQDITDLEQMLHRDLSMWRS